MGGRLDGYRRPATNATPLVPLVASPTKLARESPSYPTMPSLGKQAGARDTVEALSV